MGRYYDDELYHHGIKGQRWGVRRFQNPDGSLKAAGAKRYGVAVAKSTAAAMRMGVRRDGVTAESVKKNRPSTYSDPFSVIKKQPGTVKRSRADRAKQEAATAHKLADKYTNAMDRKAVKRQAQADAIRGTNRISSTELIRQHQANGRNTARYNPNATSAEKRGVRATKFLLPGVVPRNQKKPLDVALAERSEKKAAKAQARADRAAQEANTAKNLANKYTNAMDAKAAKRQAQAEGTSKRKGLSDRQKRALKAGAAAVAVALAMPRDVSYKYRDRIYYNVKY